MSFNSISHAGRRAFLKRSSALMATGVAAPLAMNLSAISAAAAATATDYKALVCVFMYGGNDNYNTVVPYDVNEYGTYARFRGGLATGRGALANTVLNSLNGLPDGRQFAFAPQLTGMKSLFDQQRLAVLLNVGALIQPTTAAQAIARTVPLPPKLFSHNDQQSVWQSLAPEGSTSGWGGRIGERLLSSNSQEIFTNISVGGNAVMVSGDQVASYQMTPSGSVALKASQGPVYGSGPLSAAIQQLVTSPSDHLMKQMLSVTAQRSITANTVLSGALQQGPDMQAAFTAQDRLTSQLRMVARMIASRDQIGVKRQVFFVGTGDFDNHANLGAYHPTLLSTVDSAMASFYRATEELGVAGQVTTFTASEFGRTLTNNGTGTDHGWGSHHMIMGGAVAGQRIFGTPPQLGDRGPDDAGQGRLVPTTSIEQLAATLAAWFGLSATEIAEVLPRIGNFDQPMLGFV